MAQVAPFSVNRNRDTNPSLVTPPSPEHQQFTNNRIPLRDNNNNNGFVPPNHLRKQQQPRPHSPLAVYNQVQRPDSPQQQQMGQQPSNPVTSGSTPPPQARPRGNSNTNAGHSRASSFFSSFRRQPNVETQPGDSSRPAAHAATYTPSTTRPTSSNSGINEFGGVNGSAQQQQQQQQQQWLGNDQAAANAGNAANRPPLQANSSQPAPLHSEIRSVVQLTIAHARKIYFSGPLIRHVERQADGSRPPKDEGWTDVWAQLGGTTLSIWDMKMIAEASKEGREVPPTYVNMTDAFVQVLGSVTVPASATRPARKYTDVLTLNTAGSNLFLFSCPSTAALLSWAAALRLSAWEKSRIEEIYTAHMLRITIPDVKNRPSELVKGRMEGFVSVRLAGQTDWKRLYMVVSCGQNSASALKLELSRSGSVSDGGPSNSPNMKSNRRISNLFSRDDGVHGGSHLPLKPTITMFAGNKVKERKVAVLSMREVTQVFAVYPERPELVNMSPLVKVEGLMGDEVAAGGMRSREAWLMFMPEVDGTTAGQATVMLKWVMALHDAFELYGRPKSYNWNPRDPDSLMFGYPVGSQKESLFLEREAAEVMDPRDDRTPAVRARLLNILLDKMHGPSPPGGANSTDVAPSLPPLQTSGLQNGHTNGNSIPILPQLDFEGPRSQNKGALTPITERTTESIDIRGSRSLSSEYKNFTGDTFKSYSGDSKSFYPSTVSGESPERTSILGGMPSPPPPVIVEESEESSGRDRSLGPSKKSVDGANSLRGADITNGKDLPDPPSPRSQMQSFRLSSPAVSPKESSDSPASRAASPGQPPQSSAHSHLTSPHSMLSPTGDTPPSPKSSVLTSPYSMDPHASANRPSLDVPPSPGRTSVLTSPHSVATHSALHNPYSQSNTPEPESPKLSILTSPHSLSESTQQQVLTSIHGLNDADTQSMPASSSASQSLSVVPSSRSTSNNTEESPITAALYYMQSFEEDEASKNHSRRIPTTIAEKDDETSSDSTPNNLSPRERSPIAPVASTSSVPMRRGTPGLLDRQMTMASMASSGIGDPFSPVGAHGVGRKPSGARVAPAVRKVAAMQKRDGDENVTSNSSLPTMSSQDEASTQRPATEDDNSDALAALSFLDQESSLVKTDAAEDVPPPPPPAAVAKADPSPPESTEGGSGPYRSSFAPSKQAAERKARLQANEAASHAAAHKPGRPNGNRRKSTVAGGWNNSSDEEEEEEEEEEEDDADSDEEPPPRNQPAVPPPPPLQQEPVRPLQPRGRDVPLGGPPSMGDPPHSQLRQPQPREPRHLPPLPGQQPNNFGHDSSYGLQAPGQRRTPSSQHPDNTRSFYDQNPSLRPQSEFPTPGAARQNMWSQVLDPGQNPADLTNNRDTFVQIEPPSQTMTKAFTPQGLLSAGLQDKEDRSAKKQEELARESGASLINVPNKPPPPQTGLLGAITAHERERQREGGVGAALTEREREKRIAEERQRKLDDFQRQQLEMVQSGNPQSLYQQPQFTGYNPMMGSPMMMGMNPMMTGMMGYPGMMPGFGNPQHMFAAQQAAAQAYQQAMIAYSTAGSHIVGEGEGGHGGQMLPPINPMMTGGGMSMFDPRMSMMSMGMMGSPYPGALGAPGIPGYPGMQGIQGMPSMSPQIPGSGFDHRFSPVAGSPDANISGLPAHHGPFQGQAAQPPSRHSSPGSPRATSANGSPRPGPTTPRD